MHKIRKMLIASTVNVEITKAHTMNRRSCLFSIAIFVAVHANALCWTDSWNEVSFAIMDNVLESIRAMFRIRL